MESRREIRMPSEKKCDGCRYMTWVEMLGMRHRDCAYHNYDKMMLQGECKKFKPTAVD